MPTAISFLTAGCLSLCTALAVASPAHAAYPERPVRIVVGSTAGGALDVFSRALAQGLAERTGQAFIVENRPGVAGNLAAASVAKSAPDGYTLLFAIDTTLTVNPSLYTNMPFDAASDLAAISVPVTYGQMLAVNPASPAKTLPEFLALAASEGAGARTYGSGGQGSPSHLTYAAFLAAANANLTHIPYKASGPAVVDTIGGQVDSIFAVTQAVLPHVNAGRLRSLAVSSSQRSPLAPDVPTIAESGYPDFSAEFAYAIMAPAGTPAEIVNWLNEAINQVIATPGMQKQLLEWDYAGTDLSADKSAQWLTGTREQWAGVIAQAGIKVEQ